MDAQDGEAGGSVSHQQAQLQDNAEQELLAIYAKLYRVNEQYRRNGRKDLMFTESELALVRWAFGINQ